MVQETQKWTKTSVLVQPCAYRFGTYLTTNIKLTNCVKTLRQIRLFFVLRPCAKPVLWDSRAVPHHTSSAAILHGNSSNKNRSIPVTGKDLDSRGGDVLAVMEASPAKLGLIYFE
jgi:hypothetical protein